MLVFKLMILRLLLHFLCESPNPKPFTWAPRAAPKTALSKSQCRCYINPKSVRYPCFEVSSWGACSAYLGLLEKDQDSVGCVLPPLCHSWTINIIKFYGCHSIRLVRNKERGHPDPDPNPEVWNKFPNSAPDPSISTVVKKTVLC